MRKIDADHLRQRAVNGECGGNAIDLIDTEPTAIEEDDNSIIWITSKRERRTKICHAITNGVECSRCRCFEEYPRRFCPDCGGKFNGELPIKNKYAERKIRGARQWHV
jgi:hypothetical protein